MRSHLWRTAGWLGGKPSSSAGGKTAHGQLEAVSFRSTVHVAAAAIGFAILLGVVSKEQDLRAALKESGVVEPLMQSLPELKLPESFINGLPTWKDNLSQVRWQADYRDFPGLSDFGQRLGGLLGAAEYASLPAGLRQLSFFERPPRPGLDLRATGAVPKHPVLIVPGFVTSRLEAVKNLPCAATGQRRTVWGSWDMAKAFVLNKQCWIEHLRLDEATSMDPPGVKVRPGTGFGAVDYFIGNYHVWARVFEAFWDLGYTEDNLATEPYDWRLPAPNLEERDAYFSRLKDRVERLVSTAGGVKAVIISHSWGDNVFRTFLSWVSAVHPRWVEEHIASYANVAGPTLGVPKSLSAYLSGETRDTVEMGYVTSLLADLHFSRAARVDLVRTWGGGIGMLPIGGTAFWGNATSAPDDPVELTRNRVSYGPMITSWDVQDENAEEAEERGSKLLDTFSPHGPPAAVADNPGIRQLDVEKSIQLLLAEAGPVFEKNAAKWSATEHAARPSRPGTCAAHKAGDDFHYSPLSCPLPDAPSLQMFCLYGVGNPTERGYHYQNLKTDKAFEAARRDDAENGDPTDLDVRYRVHAELSDGRLGVSSGVVLSDGDGTVPLLSLGALCRKQWRRPELNPAGFRVVSREYLHEPLASSRQAASQAVSPYLKWLRGMARGGPRSADHVDVLSHEDVLADLLRIAAGNASALQDQLLSRIDSIVEQL